MSKTQFRDPSPQLNKAPTLPASLIQRISEYGDARADDGDSAQRLGAAIEAIRAWGASLAVPSPEGEEQPTWTGAVAFLQHVQNAAGAPGQWPDEFLAWYKPDEWFGEHRAAAVFVGQKIAALAAQPQSDNLRAERDQLLEQLAAAQREVVELRAGRQSPAEAHGIEVSVGRMTESNGRVTWMVMLHRAGSQTLLNGHQVYGSHIEGRAQYEAAALRHFLGQGPEPDILDYDTDGAAQADVQPKGTALDRDDAIRTWHRHCDKFSDALGKVPPSPVIDAMLAFAREHAQPSAEAPASSRLVALVMELAEAVDNAADDIGGSRPQLDILREAVQAAAQAQRGQP